MCCFASIDEGWAHGLLEQLEAGAACGTLFSHPPHHESSWFFFFCIVCLHNIPARGARVVVDSTLPLVFVPIRFLRVSCKSVSPRWRRNSLRKGFCWATARRQPRAHARLHAAIHVQARRGTGMNRHVSVVTIPND